MNGRAFIQGELRSLDIWAKDGKIAALGGQGRAEEVVNAAGKIVLPGAIDLHVHFREPGPTYKEDWESGSMAAAAGGVTTVADQPNTDPRTDDAQSFDIKLDLAKRKSLVDFCINGGPGDIKALVRQGARAIGEIFAYEHSDRDLQRILQETLEAGALPTLHAEDGRVIAEMMKTLAGQNDPDVYSRARPAKAEAASIEKALSWSDRLHICHLSTARGLQMVGEARGQGRKVSCEVAPHHLIFTRKDYKSQGTLLKMNPPLREPADAQALWQGLHRGTIDIIASDHAPHLPEEKRQEVWEAPAGVPGVETMLPLMLHAVRSNRLTIERLVDAISARPADLLGLKSKGSIALGKDCDLVVVDPRKVSRISVEDLHSRCDWTPYEGREAVFPAATILRGTVVFDGDIEVGPGFGRHLGKNFYQSQAESNI